MARTANEIVVQTNVLAAKLYQIRGYTAREGYRFDQATHPHEVEAWEGACEAQKMLTDTDPNDALSEMEDVPQPAHAGYVNFGGIGLTVNERGELEGLAGNEMRTLNLRNLDGEWVTHYMPSKPWTMEGIKKVLEVEIVSKLIDEQSPLNAYLGDCFLGGTEL